MSKTTQETTFYLCDTCGKIVEMTINDSLGISRMNTYLIAVGGLPLVVVCYSCAFESDHDDN